MPSTKKKEYCGLVVTNSCPFKTFDDLPAELRFNIWEYSLQAGAITLHYHVWPMTRTDAYGNTCTSPLVYTPNNSRNHAVPRTTREARHVATNICGLQPLPVWTDNNSCGRGWAPSRRLRTIYVNWKTDVFYFPDTYPILLRLGCPLIPAPHDPKPLPIRRLMLGVNQAAWVLIAAKHSGYESMKFFQALDECWVLFSSPATCEKGNAVSDCDECDPCTTTRQSALYTHVSGIVQGLQDLGITRSQLCEHSQHPFVRNIVDKNGKYYAYKAFLDR